VSSNELSADEAPILLAPAEVPADAVDRLSQARVTLVGRMRNASNGTFLVRLDDPASSADDVGAESPPWGLAIYKPVRGERPLWDFEPGLFRREVAAYVLSEAMGIGAVPPTVVRDDAPFGEGSLQWFVNADFSHHYFSIMEEHPELLEQLQAIAAFDVVANNTDRKGGHCLLDPRAERVWAIDNGLCFAASFKLRTVIWEFAGDPIPPAVLDAVRGIAARAPEDLAGLLTVAEIRAVERRAAQLVDMGVFPFDQSSHGYPWPLV
jgi:uncharacterized repeat protein (TIGR03843 family)